MLVFCERFSIMIGESVRAQFWEKLSFPWYWTKIGPTWSFRLSLEISLLDLFFLDPSARKSCKFSSVRPTVALYSGLTLISIFSMNLEINKHIKMMKPFLRKNFVMAKIAIYGMYGIFRPEITFLNSSLNLVIRFFWNCTRWQTF